MTERSAEEIAARIRTLRSEAGLTQADLARALELDKSAISRIENGERGLAVAELSGCARVLGVTVDDLLFDGVEEEVLMRAEDDQHAADAAALTDALIEDFLYVEALIG